MALTIQTLAEKATLEARGGFSEAESGINVARAALLIPEMFHELAEEVASDGARRDLMTTEWNIPLVDGKADLSVSDYDYLLRSALCYSVAFDGDDFERTTPLVWQKAAHRLNWGNSNSFGYYALQGNTLKTRKVNGSLAEMQSLVLIASYIPAMGTNAPDPNPYVLTPELEDDAVKRLAAKLQVAARVGF